MDLASTDGPGSTSAPFRVAVVPGVLPHTWFRLWGQRVPAIPLEVISVHESDQLAVLRDGRADMGFVRPPIDFDGLSLITLYAEIPVVLVPTHHPVAAREEVSVVDLADEHLLQDADLVPAWRDIANEVREGLRLAVPTMTMPSLVDAVAAGDGVVIVPLSLARLTRNPAVVHRPVTGVPDSKVGLAWLTAAKDPRFETFIGIVRGRTERSSRGDGVLGAADAPVPAKSGPSGRRRRTPRGGR